MGGPRAHGAWLGCGTTGTPRAKGTWSRTGSRQQAGRGVRRHRPPPLGPRRAGPRGGGAGKGPSSTAPLCPARAGSGERATRRRPWGACAAAYQDVSRERGGVGHRRREDVVRRGAHVGHRHGGHLCNTGARLSAPSEPAATQPLGVPAPRTHSRGAEPTLPDLAAAAPSRGQTGRRPAGQPFAVVKSTPCPPCGPGSAR